MATLPHFSHAHQFLCISCGMRPLHRTVALINTHGQKASQWHKFMNPTSELIIILHININEEKNIFCIKIQEEVFVSILENPDSSHVSLPFRGTMMETITQLTQNLGLGILFLFFKSVLTSGVSICFIDMYWLSPQ